MDNNVEFLERYVFTYNAEIDGLGILEDVYESFNIKGILTLRMLHDNKIINMSEEQYQKVLQAINNNSDEIIILVFYELNKLPLLVYFSDDYIEIEEHVYEYNENYLKRTKYKQLETTVRSINWAKNNPQMKYLRYYICNPQELHSKD